MNKRMREIISEIEARREVAKGYLGEDGKDLEKAQQALDEIAVLEKEYGLNEQAERLEKAAVTDEDIHDCVPAQEDATKAFVSACRSLFKGMTEGTAADGGYTVPKDIQTRVIELRDAVFSLRQLVGVENVATLSGSRTYKKRSQQVGFTVVAEGATTPAIASPKFGIIDYVIKKYSGFLPATDELLADSDANIVAIISKWLADEARVTDNKLILAQVTAKAAVAIDGITGIKEALNVTLGQAFAPTSRIITNDSGLQWLDTLYDANGRALLRENVLDPLTPYLAVGFRAVPLVVVPEADLPSTGGTLPFVIGDLSEGIKVFDRQHLTIATSTEASIGEVDAFAQHLTLFRGTLREDVKTFDEEAFINATIDPSEAETVG